jgi:3-hydroxyacyl-CoA dehydrogenase
MTFAKRSALAAPGTMGRGIAQVCAVGGLTVTMVDVDEAAVARGRNAVSSSLDRLVRNEKLSAAEKEAAFRGFHTNRRLGGEEFVRPVSFPCHGF